MMEEDLLRRDPPVVLIVAEAQSVEIGLALEAAGWTCRHAKAGSLKAEIARHPISLVLLSLADAEAAHQEALMIRSAALPVAAAPILYVGSPENDPDPSNFDALLPSTMPLQMLARALECWKPVSLAPTRRIALMLGAGPVAGMIERLGRRLEPALADLASGIIDKGEAHRLAGLCGTLGFRQAHAVWLDLSLGDDTVIEDVRRTTRLTLAAIARGL